jgi:hypothetical protein
MRALKCQENPPIDKEERSTKKADWRAGRAKGRNVTTIDLRKQKREALRAKACLWQ